MIYRVKSREEIAEEVNKPEPLIAKLKDPRTAGLKTLKELELFKFSSNYNTLGSVNDLVNNVSMDGSIACEL